MGVDRMRSVRCRDNDPGRRHSGLSDVFLGASRRNSLRDERKDCCVTPLLYVRLSLSTGEVQEFRNVADVSQTFGAVNVVRIGFPDARSDLICRNAVRVITRPMRHS